MYACHSFNRRIPGLGLNLFSDSTDHREVHLPGYHRNVLRCGSPFPHFPSPSIRQHLHSGWPGCLSFNHQRLPSFRQQCSVTLDAATDSPPPQVSPSHTSKICLSVTASALPSRVSRSLSYFSPGWISKTLEPPFSAVCDRSSSSNYPSTHPTGLGRRQGDIPSIFLPMLH